MIPSIVVFLIATSGSRVTSLSHALNRFAVQPVVDTYTVAGVMLYTDGYMHDTHVEMHVPIRKICPQIRIFTTSVVIIDSTR